MYYHPLWQLKIHNVDDVYIYSIYCACIWIIQQLYDIRQNDEEDDAIKDAAYLYELCFVDLFYNCIDHMDDEYLTSTENTQTPWELYYPHDTRAFCADDLPNLFHMLWHIPLWGEVDAPNIPMMKFIIKCMPFACQRRQLLDQIDYLCQGDASQFNQFYCRDEGFWRIFNKIIWCSLAGVYPSTKIRPDFRKLLRIKQLCDNRTLLMDCLTRNSAKDRATELIQDQNELQKELKRIKKEREENCLIIFTSVRLFVIHMAHHNPHYATVAHECINWPSFQQETSHMGDIIRGSNLYLEDAFAEARILLTRSNKNEKRFNH